MAASPDFLPRHLPNVVPHSVIMQLLYWLPHSIILLYDAISAFMSRSALISVVNKRYSSPVHVVSRRQRSILFPHAVSVSPAHLEKSLPHLACMHARRAPSHAFLPDDALADSLTAVAADDASSAARWARICSDNALSAPSVLRELTSPSTSSNIDDLFSIISSGSSMVTWAIGSSLAMGVSAVAWVVVVVVVVGMRDALLRRWVRDTTDAPYDTSDITPRISAIIAIDFVG